MSKIIVNTLSISLAFIFGMISASSPVHSTLEEVALGSGIQSVDVLAPEKCELEGGQYNDFGECIGVNKQTCQDIGGIFDSCASHCRNETDQNIVCIDVCVEVCYMNRDLDDSFYNRVDNYDDCNASGGEIFFGDDYTKCVLKDLVFMQKSGDIVDDKEDDQNTEEEGDQVAGVKISRVIMYSVIIVLLVISYSGPYLRRKNKQTKKRIKK